MQKVNNINQIYAILQKEYKDACCTLKYESDHQFLFANIMSPQTTDEAVNKISHELCVKFNSIESIAQANIAEIENIIRPLGFYKVKSRYIQRSAEMLLKDFNSTLPSTLEELQRFPGIGRKTALVILKVVFKRFEGIIIDTHNIRIVNRLGIIGKKEIKNAVIIEQKLMKLLPISWWGKWSDLMVFHGRAICRARNPLCKDCPVAQFCRFGQISNNN